MWLAVAGRPAIRVMPPKAGRQLDDMRHRQIDAGQEPWLRADITIIRRPGDAAPEFKVNFAYEVGDIPV